jgi:DNA-binding beta-propeller fold protein YncE
MAGCATQQPKVEETKLSWPPPPDTARIQFVRTIYSDQDLTTDTTFTQNVINFLAGSKPAPNRIVEPMGLAVSDDGQTLYVADAGWQQVFIFDFPHKKFSRIEGFVHPLGIALDGQQNLYVVDQVKRGVQVVDAAGNKVRFFTDKSLIHPTGIAIDRQRGKIYVADTSNKESLKEHNVKIFNMSGTLIGHIGDGYGFGPTNLLFPTYIALDSNGNVFVTDTLNNRVQEFDTNGKFVRQIGRNGNIPGTFGRPKGVAVDSLGDVYVADSAWSNVQIFNREGQVLMFFSARGPAPGYLRNPTAVAISKDNNIYVGDYINHRVEEYKLVNTVLADTLGNGAMVAASK